MSIYVIYNRETGDVAHVHIEPDEVETPRDRLFHLARPGQDHGRLEVAVISPQELARGIGAKVDVATGRPRPAERGTGVGARFFRAGVSVKPRTVRRVYRSVPGGANDKSA